MHSAGQISSSMICSLAFFFSYFTSFVDNILCVQQDLLSIANIAEQHEVWDFLSASSKVCSLHQPNLYKAYR